MIQKNIDENHCKRIVIIEDDQAIRETLSMALELEGYEVHSAGNGKEGIEVLAKLPVPSLILLDLMMPVMDGWEFAAALESDYILATVPIVVLTAFNDKSKSIKVKEVLKKPIELDALFRVAKQYCGI